MATTKPTTTTKAVETNTAPTVKTKTPATHKAPATKTVVTKTVVTKTNVIKPTLTKPIEVQAKASAATAKKVEKEKPVKLKMERDSFTMPKAEYAQIYVLKERLVKLGQPVKKSELLRAGLMLLSALNEVELKATMAKIPTIKTGRPKK